MKSVLAIVALAGVVICARDAGAQATSKTLFVTNNQGNPGSVASLKVRDDGTLQLVGTYYAGQMPQDGALTRDGRYLLVLNNTTANNAQSIHVMHVLPDGALAPAGTVGGIPAGPLSLHITSRNLVLVPSLNTRSLCAFNLVQSTLAWTNSVDAGEYPMKALSTEDGRFAFCIGPNRDFDVVRFSISDTGMLANLGGLDIPGGGGFGAALRPGGDMLYVSTGPLNSIHCFEVDQDSGALASVGFVNPGGNSVTELAVHPSGEWLYSCHSISDELRVTRINPNGTLSPTQFSYLIRADVRDVVTDGENVYVTDETQLGGGQVGVVAFRINENGSLSQNGPATLTGGLRPQFMALWTPSALCLGDANGDGFVGFADIAAVLGNQGMPGPVGDADHDGDVDFDDLTAALGNQGPCQGATLNRTDRTDGIQDDSGIKSR